jgi:hypothetical protein
MEHRIARTEDPEVNRPAMKVPDGEASFARPPFSGRTSHVNETLVTTDGPSVTG